MLTGVLRILTFVKIAVLEKLFPEIFGVPPKMRPVSMLLHVPREHEVENRR